MSAPSRPDGPLDVLATWDVPHAAAAVFGRDGIVDAHGDIDRAFALASVSKVLTAVTCLIAVEEGTVSLEDAVGPPGSTLRHLLAHAGGLGPEAGSDPLASVGARRIYSNHGFELAAAHVAARADMDFDAYATAALIDTLDLTATTLTGSPAHAFASSVRDLAGIVGSGVNHRVLAPTTTMTLITPQFPDLAGVLPGYGRQDPNPWGLGVEIRGHKTPHWTSPSNGPSTWGHFGQAGTFVWFDPDADIGLVVLSDRAFGPWAIDAWPTLATAVLDQHR